MSESIHEILERLRLRVDGPGRSAGPVAAGDLPSDGGDVNVLTTDQITSAVHVIAPAQVSYVAELFANSMANALNMRAMAPRIRQIAEQSLRSALGSAKKQGAPKI